jgi:hypothetical protein
MLVFLSFGAEVVFLRDPVHRLVAMRTQGLAPSVLPAHKVVVGQEVHVVSSFISSFVCPLYIGFVVPNEDSRFSSLFNLTGNKRDDGLVGKTVRIQVLPSELIC